MLSENAPENAPENAIIIDKVSKTYQTRKGRQVQAVQKLSLVVQRGQVFGFLGANGAGKTTTIKMACGLVMPTAGQIRVNGYDVHRQRGRAMRQMGTVLEGTRNVYWRLSAWQNLMYFGRLKGVTGKQLKLRAEQLLQELDLWDRRNDPLRMFSRGMQQKVAIACALVSDPPIVLLDEPTLGLDVKAARSVKQWISALAEEQGKTVVLTTHQLAMAQELCHRVAIMSHGRLIANRPTTELLDLFRQEYYQLRFAGSLDDQVLGQFEGFTPRRENGETILSGILADGTTVYDLVDRARALGLELTAVAQVEPNLEEVFVRLIDAADGVGAADVHAPMQAVRDRSPVPAIPSIRRDGSGGDHSA